MKIAGTVPRPIIPFFLILCFGTFLRFHALDRQSLWDDELSTLRTISTPLPQIVQRFETWETHPPLYFLQLKVWRLLQARSLVKLRANSAGWGSLSLILIFLLGRQYGGDALGLLAMAILAVSPFHLAYSQELRPYAMAVAIALAGGLNLERVLSGRRGAFPLQIILWTVQLYTHYWGMFIVASQIAYGLWMAPQDTKKKIFIAGALSGLLFSVWVPVISAQMTLTNNIVFWASPFSIKNLGKVFLAYSGLFFNMASSSFYLPTNIGIFIGLGIIFAGVLMMGIWRGPRGAVFWLLGLGIPWILSLWKPPIFLWYRYTVQMLPAFILLIAAGLLLIRVRVLFMGFILIVLGSQVYGDWTYFHGWQKANPKAVTAYVHHLRKPGTLVVRPSYFGNLFNFYDLGTTAVIDEDLLDSPEKRAALKEHPIIFVAFDVPSDPVGDAILQEMPPISARYFPGTAHLGITVYDIAQSDKVKPRMGDQ